jgi:hypothetical protein
MNKGWVNFSYEICTNRGNYIVQILGGEYSEWKKNQMRLQFAVLNHLKDKNFPYHLVGIRIGSYITNQDNCVGDFISVTDSWWSLKGSCDIITKNVL